MSIDIDGDSLITEWQLNDREIASNPPNRLYGTGEYTIKLRVQDEHGLWSEWVSKNFTINTPSTLIAAYDMNELSSTTIYDKTNSYNGTKRSGVSLTGDGLYFNGSINISKVDFNNQVIPSGNKSIRFRIKTLNPYFEGNPLLSKSLTIGALLYFL